MRKTPCLLLFVPALLLADEVYLEGAGVISGRIVEQTDTMIKVNVGDGIIGVPTSRVERIVKARSPLDDYDERAGALSPGDVKGWRNLGRWASQQGLSSQSREAYQHVLGLAADDPEARQALGFVQLDGRWVTEEESYRARGYVRHQGEWMTQAEVQRAEAADEAYRAQKQAEQRAYEAELAAEEAQARAREAEERAKKAEEERRQDYPVYWGNWGYGVNYWPSSPVVRTPAGQPSAPSMKIIRR